MKKIFMFFILLSCSALAQQISYIIPDIGTPGLNSYVEIIGPYNATGNFGSNGLYLNNTGDNVRIELVRPADSTKINFGPLVVSWSGRLISSQAFINPFVNPNSEYWYNLDPAFRIPYRVYVNGNYSNVDTFYIVKPFLFGDLSGTAHWEIGSGSLGVRSRRGAMIIGYTKFGNANYSIAKTDCDPYSIGNQGYLPFILLSKDRLEGNGSNTNITASGNGRMGGPGGGGGGGRFCDATFLNPSIIGEDGGDGYTGGGPGGRNASTSGTTDAFKNYGAGTGVYGASLNGVPPPTQGWTESSGGGTGHPFGQSGQGCNDGYNCDPPGGYGGGTGYRQNSRGGAGGFRSPGSNSGTSNGGKVNGNEEGIPIAGGSGGASGNPNSPGNCSGDGGGGGGAVRIAARSISRISFRSLGADGTASSYGTQATGGAGSGGFIEIGGKLTLANSTVVVTGGNNGLGGLGQIRIDAPTSLGITLQPAGVNSTQILTTDTTTSVYKKFTLTGSKNQNLDSIRLYIKKGSNPWILDTVLVRLRGFTSWERNYYLPGPDSIYYIVAIGDRQGYTESSYTASLQYLMTQSAANIIFKNKNPEILADTVRRFRALACEGKMVIDSFYIHNRGDAGLQVNFNTSRWAFGNRGIRLNSPNVRVWVNPGDSVRVFFEYNYQNGQRGIIRDTLFITHNDMLASSNPIKIAVEVTIDTVSFNLLDASLADKDTLNFGKICIGDSSDLHFYITNRSSIGLLVFELQTGDADFKQTENVSSLILPGSKISGTVKFKPTKVGKLKALLIYSSSECNEVKDTLVLVGSGISGAFEYEKPLDVKIDTLVLDSYCIGGSVHSYFLVRNYGGQTLTFTPNQRFVTQKFIYESHSLGTIQENYWDTVYFDIWPLTEGPIEIKIGTGTFQCGGFTDSLVILLTGVKADLAYIGSNDFGVLNNDYRDTLTIQIKNQGTANIHVTSLTQLKPPFSYIDIQPPLPVVLKPGESIFATIEFYPRKDGLFLDTIKPVMLLSDSTCIDSKVFPIKGISTSSRLILSTDTLNFGLLEFCDEEQDSVIITNPTTVTISLTNPRIIGPDVSYFLEVQGFTSPRVLAPGQSAVYYIRFKPVKGPDGIKRATFVVNSDFPKDPEMKCELIGEQENLKISFSPPNLAFGSVPIGIQRNQTIRVTNNGRIAQDLKDVIISNPDMSAAPKAAFLAPGGGFVNIVVTFKPTAAGSADANIRFIFEGKEGGCRDSLETKITASGQEGQVIITPRILFELNPPCSDVIDSMTVTNTGVTQVIIDSMIIDGPDKNLFAFSDGVSTPITLDSGQTLTRKVRYLSASPNYGLKNAYIITYVNVGAKTKSDTTLLQAEKRNFITITPSPLLFGNVVVGQFSEQILTLTNKGNSAVVITGIKPPKNINEFMFNPDPIGLTINPNSSQTVRFRFRPNAPVIYWDTVGVVEVYVSNCVDSSYFIVNGTGIPPIDTRIIIDTVSDVNPRDYNLSIPIRAYIVKPVSTVSNLEFKARISFNATMYNLKKITNASISHDSVYSNRRIVDFIFAGVSLRNDTSVIGYLVGRPLLGNSDFTMINWDKFEWMNPSAFGTTDTIPGSIRTTICLKGGARLLNPGLPLTLSVAPNPAGNEINILATTIETGYHIIRFYDARGTDAILAEFDVDINGSHEFTFNVNISAYSSGFYYLVLTSPTEKIIKPVYIVK